MRVRSKFLLSASTSVAFSTIVLLFVFTILKDMKEESARAEVYSDIQSQSAALNLFITGMRSHPSATRLHQINETWIYLKIILGQLRPVGIREESLVRHIRANASVLEYSLAKLLSQDSKAAISNEQREVLLPELWIKIQFISDDTRKLMELSQSKLKTAHQHADVLVYALIIGLILINAAITFFFGRSIIRSENKLKKALGEAEEGRESLRQSQQEQVRQREFLQTLLDNALACIAVMQGHELRYTMVNRAYQALRPEMEMIGRTCREVFPEAAALGAEALLQKVLETGNPQVDFSYPAPVPGKPDAAWDHQIVRLPAREGEATKVLLITWDATERERMTDQLRLLTETLEQKVAERTALAESRSRQLQALAIELIETEERERRQFSHLLHEDLQQMLAAAKMEVQSVADCRPLEPVLLHAVRLLEESIEKSRQLSQDLSPAILQQGGLIAALTWLSRRMKDQFGIDIDMDLNTELLMERTPQKVFLFRAVQELLFNIVKHSGVQKTKVEVTSSEDLITVTVSDQGCGFDPGILLNRTGKLGFGLLTIKERASYIGGRFIIESAPGQGSRFTLTVPSAAADGHEETFADPYVAEEN